MDRESELKNLGLVPVNAEEWSPQSKRSLEYSDPPKYYADVSYFCWKCGASAVFSAQDQKHKYEVRKAYIWQRRTLCGSCYKERVGIEIDVAEYRRAWKTNRASLTRNQQALSRWLNLLCELPSYGVRADVANVAMLRRVLGAGAPNHSLKLDGPDGPPT